MIKIDDMQFGFMQGHGTTDATGNILCKEQKSVFCFCRSRAIFWQGTLPSPLVGYEERNDELVHEWIIHFVQAMYHNVISKVCIENLCSELRCPPRLCS